LESIVSVSSTCSEKSISPDCVIVTVNVAAVTIQLKASASMFTVSMELSLLLSSIT